MASIGGTLGLSGLPLQETLDKLRVVEEAPLKVLANRKTVMEAKISAYGMISNALSTLQTSVKTVGKADTFGTLKATSSNDKALTATAPANGGAVAGKYTIAVDNLATNQSLAAAGVADTKQSLGTGGTITFTLGDGTTRSVELGSKELTLESLRSAINKATVADGEDTKPLGITATLLNNGDANAPHQLVLSTGETGLASRITKIEVSGNTAPGTGPSLSDLLAYEEPAGGESDVVGSGTITQMSQVSAAQNAALSINGIAVTSASNTLEGAIEGVTLNLLAPTTEGSPLTLTIAADHGAATSAIQSFASTYNALQTVIRQLTSFDVEAETASALTGDRVPRAVQTQLRNVLGEVIDNGGFATLAQIGITTNINTGALDVDTTKLAKALKDDPDKVAALFTGENGLAAKLETSIKSMLDSKGLISNAQEGLKTSAKDLTKQYERVQMRVEDTMARYQAQFVALEKLVSQMNGTSTYLAQQLDMLAATTKNSSK